MPRPVPAFRTSGPRARSTRGVEAAVEALGRMHRTGGTGDAAPGIASGQLVEQVLHAAAGIQTAGESPADLGIDDRHCRHGPAGRRPRHRSVAVERDLEARAGVARPQAGMEHLALVQDAETAPGRGQRLLELVHPRLVDEVRVVAVISVRFQLAASGNVVRPPNRSLAWRVTRSMPAVMVSKALPKQVTSLGEAASVAPGATSASRSRAHPQESRLQTGCADTLRSVAAGTHPAPPGEEAAISPAERTGAVSSRPSRL